MVFRIRALVLKVKVVATLNKIIILIYYFVDHNYSKKIEKKIHETIMFCLI